MKKYSPHIIRSLTNWDGLLSQKPFRNEGEERQYYSRFLGQRLWRYLTEEDWKRINVLLPKLRITEKNRIAAKAILRLKKK